MKIRVASTLVVSLCASTAVLANTYTVTTVADDGAGSLRQAILDANANPGADSIHFAIPGSGVHTISPASPLPAITDPLTITGFSQPGSSPNTNGPGQPDNSIHLIEIDATSACTGFGALDLAAGSQPSTIRGLVVNRCLVAAVILENGGGNVVAGNFLGTDPSGSTALANGDGVEIEDLGAGETADTIGGTDPADRNVISGNTTGIEMGLTAAGNLHVIQGNFIGTNAAGSLAVPNGTGIDMGVATTDVTVGGLVPGSGNLISGNQLQGISVRAGSGIVIQGNLIGTDLTATAAVGNGTGGIGIQLANAVTVGGAAPGAANVISGNGQNGIVTYAAIVQGNFIGVNAAGAAIPNAVHGIQAIGSGVAVGGIGAGEANAIAFNGADGVEVDPSALIVRIRGNSIHDNGALGIDLGGDGVTPNDPGDGDGGANNFQNFPVISSVTYGASTEVVGLLNATPSTGYDLDFYANPPCSNFPREFLQGATYLGSGVAITDDAGNAPFDVTGLAAAPDGSRISVTATDSGGNTSEFSQRLPFASNPTSGPAAGGTVLTISGTNFLAGASVAIGGQPATDVAVVSYTTLNATAPALTAGSANDIVVTNTDGTNGTLAKGYVADFLDVPPAQQFYSYVTTLVSNGITAGIGGGLYGVNDNTLRQQMAVFLLKAKHGLCYTPPACTGLFPDVPCPSTFADWIEALSTEGITGGCGGGNYCPQDSVRRDQMAVFLLKAEHGSGYVPPPCQGAFPDVQCPSLFADWIEQLAAEGITGGCGGGNYCPSNPNTRGQMAVFLTRTFGLQ